MKILVALLSANASYFMIKYLKDIGHEVVSAYNMNDAQLALNDDLPDCIITDLTGQCDGPSNCGSETHRIDDWLEFLGWKWVKNDVLPKYPYPERIIFYSSDYDEFKRNFPDEDIDSFCIVHMIGDRSWKTNGVEKILKRLNEIEALGKLPV